MRRQPLIIINSLVRAGWRLLALAKRVGDGVSLCGRGGQELLDVSVRVMDIAEALVAIRVGRAAALPSEP